MKFITARVRGAEIHFQKDISDEDAAKVLALVAQVEGVVSITAIKIDRDRTINVNITGDNTEEQVAEVLTHYQS